MYAQVGQFRQMAADLDRLIRVSPDEPLLYMEAACAYLYLGDETAYRNLCQRMLQRFGASTALVVHDRVAKTCLAGPRSVPDLAPVLGMARSNIDPAVLKTLEHPDLFTKLFRLCAAMAEYRSGHPQTVLDILDDSTCNQLAIEPKATALLFRAMAHHALKDQKAARLQFGAAQSLFSRVASPTAEIIEPDATIQDWFIAQTVRKEAEKLIAGE